MEGKKVDWWKRATTEHRNVKAGGETEMERLRFRHGGFDSQR